MKYLTAAGVNADCWLQQFLFTLLLDIYNTFCFYYYMAQCANLYHLLFFWSYVGFSDKYH